MRNFSLLITLPTALLLAGCAIGPDYERPDLTTPIKWPWDHVAEAATKGESTVRADWWQNFNDPVLSQLIDEGLKGNDDLAIAAARVAEARGLLSGYEADMYPSIDLNGGFLRQSQSQEARFGAIPLNSKPFNQITLSAVLSWEIDLWGKLRRANEAGRASLLASKANQDAVRLAVISDIATGYFNLRALDAQMEVTENTITSRNEAYQYQEKQYKAGSIDGLTYRQAEAELASTKAQLPQIRQARDAQVNALSVLLGRNPDQIVAGGLARGASIDELPSPPAIPTDAPSTLLERRPDVQFAEQSLIASNALIGVAKADYFPSISLSGLLGLGSADIDRLLRSSARTWQLGGSLAGPLIDFGRTSANVDVAEATRDNVKAQYTQTVRNAFAQVLDSMNATNNTAEQSGAQEVQTTARAETLRLAKMRYDAGYSNYLEVLDAQRFLYQAQLDRIDAKRSQLTAAVNLYKALGGGWTKDQIEQDKPAEAKTVEEPKADTPKAEAEATPATATEAAPAAVEAPKLEAKPAPNTGFLTLPTTIEDTKEPAVQ